MKNTTDTPEPTPPPPSACPFCGAGNVVTTSEKVGPDSYWRCAACGEMWNTGRLRAPNRFTSDYRWK